MLSIDLSCNSNNAGNRSNFDLHETEKIALQMWSASGETSYRYKPPTALGNKICPDLSTGSSPRRDNALLESVADAGSAGDDQMIRTIVYKPSSKCQANASKASDQYVAGSRPVIGDTVYCH